MAEAIDIRELNIRIEQQSQFVTNLVMGMNKVIVGQKHLVDCLLIGLLSDGHILLEGVPGLAKTLAIKTLSQLVSADYSRIQFTPDLLPADVVGTQIYSQKDETFHVKRGPVFANFVLADEINRAPAKVQSALLEAMQEHQVTIGEQTFKLPNPFLVMATQNPVEQEGTYQLPEAQVDRFLLKVIIDYPTIEEEKLIIRENIQGGLPTVTPVTTAEEILKARSIVNEVYIDEKIEQYIADIVFATRYPDRYGLGDLKDMITFGGSPRASISLAKAARAYAFIKHRGYVIPEDVRAVAHDVLRHRIGLFYEQKEKSHELHASVFDYRFILFLRSNPRRLSRCARPEPFPRRATNPKRISALRRHKNERRRRRASGHRRRCGLLRRKSGTGADRQACPERLRGCAGAFHRPFADQQGPAGGGQGVPHSKRGL